ncbi:MAG: alcohol dehydrogenase catalytic domain-containing protein [Armatimonadetes bacterium]|nr:alcohol dehydrogenase catalytic domain-containing protein [Armatimonadota bacterium]
MAVAMAKAIQIVAPERFEIVEIPIPEPADDEVLIEVLACSTCTNWELSMWRGRDIFGRMGEPKYPLNPGAPGHEAAGRVIACGSSVRRLRPGDYVAVKPQTRGPENDAHSTHIVRPESEVALVDENVPPEEAAPLEMVMCALRSVELAGAITGSLGIVVGLGPAGILHLQALRLAGVGATVGVEPLEKRREIAAPFADAVLAPGDPSLGEWLRAWPTRIVFECSGASQAMETALRLATNRVHVFAVPDGRWVYDQRAWLSGVAIVPYSWRGRAQADVLEKAARLVGAGLIRTAPLISAIMPYERYPEAMEMLASREALKIVFRWSESLS